MQTYAALLALVNVYRVPSERALCRFPSDQPDLHVIVTTLTTVLVVAPEQCGVGDKCRYRGARES